MPKKKTEDINPMQTKSNNENPENENEDNQEINKIITDRPVVKNKKKAKKKLIKLEDEPTVTTKIT